MIYSFSYGNIPFSARSVFTRVLIRFVALSVKKQGIVRVRRRIAFCSSAAHRAVGTHLPAQVISRIISLPAAFCRANTKTGGTPDTYRRNALFAFLVVLRNDARNFLLGLHDLVVEALG